MSASEVESTGLPERGPAPRATQNGAAWGAARSTPVTFTLIGVCVLLWGLSNWWEGGSGSVLWYLGANQGQAVRSGQVYRLLSCLFLHLGGVHLLLNMIALRALSQLELALGHSRFLSLYFLAGLGASLSTALLQPEVLSVGASGAIWGLMGAMFGMRIPTRHVLRARGIRLSTGWPVLAVNLAISFLPGVDLSAHLGGGLVGFLLGASVFYPDYTGARSSRPARRGAAFWAPALGAGAAGLLLATALVAALVEGQPWRFAAPPNLRRVSIHGTGLSVELPEPLDTELQTPRADQPDAWQFGTPGRSPLWVTLQRVDTSLQLADPLRKPPAEQLENWLTQLRLEIEREPVDPQLPRTSLELTSLGDQRVVRDEYRGPDLHVVRYFTYVGPHPVDLDVVRFRHDTGEVWPGVEERIAASLRYDRR